MQVSLANTTDTIAALDRLKEHPGLEIATGMSKFLDPRNLPGFSGSDARILIKQLGNRNFVEALSAMKANSRTGGAVGQVSDREGERLENVIAALSDTDISDEGMLEQMQIARDILERYKTDLQAAFDTQFGTASSALSGFSAEDIDAAIARKNQP